MAGVTVEVEAGEILGLVGPNGSGKSTLINTMCGIISCTSGQITFCDEDITRMPAHDIIHHGIARTFQIPRPFASMTVLENASISGMFGRDSMSIRQARENAMEALHFTGLEKYSHQPVNQLNLHQRKFLELARALASHPRLLLLDEVNAGLNPTEIDKSIEMIKKIHAQGVTIIIVEHLMKVVTSLSTRLVVLDHGRVIANGEPGAVMQEPEVITAYLGKDYANN